MTDAYTESHKIAVYADNNGGKTHQIRYLIREYGHENVGIINGERGLGTIRGDVREEQVFHINNVEDISLAFKWAKEKYDRPGAWVCMDGCTNIMQMLMSEHFDTAIRCVNYIIMKGAETLPKELKLYQRFVTFKDGCWNKDDRALYGHGGRQAERFWSAWVRQDWNIYATFWKEKTGQGDGKRVLPYGHDVPGKMGFSAIRGAFDYIMHLEPEGKSFTATCRADPAVYVTKMREDRDLGISVPDTIKNFNIVDFVKALTPNGGKR